MDRICLGGREAKGDDMSAFEIKRLSIEDLDMVLNVSEGLFDNPIDPLQARDFLTDPLHELLLAYDGNEAVGMVSASVLLHPDKMPSLFINEVGTRDGWTRRGIATALVQRMIEIGRERGCKGVWLGTEEDNTPARALYKSLGADEVKGVYYGWDGALDEE